MKRRPLSRNIAIALHFSHGGGAFSSVVLVGFSVVLMLFSALMPQVFDRFREGAADVFSPVLSVVSQPVQRVAAFVRDVTGLAELQTDNARLQLENDRLREWYQNALLLQAENRSLRELLNVKLDPQITYVSARVIADAGNTYVKSFLVAAGSRDGVEKGQAVVAGEGVIGRIVEVSQSTSRVLLVTDMNARVPVVVADTSQHAIMAGTNTEKPELIYLPQDSDVAQNVRLVTSGYGGIFPQGIPVGRVILDEKGQKRVALYADMDRIIFVRILKIPDDPNLRAGALLQGRD